MAAVVFIPPSPHDTFSNMTSTARRAPLASIPNATNSPHRFLTTSGSKRSRALTSISQQENEPPHKRQALDKSVEERTPVTPRRQSQSVSVEARVFERGNGDSGTTAFQRRLVAARDRLPQTKITKATEGNLKDVENIRQWQKHYRKLFPNYRFYFDSVPDDTRTRLVRQLHYLGAREEKFFSKTVTHVVTTRPIPAGQRGPEDVTFNNDLTVDDQNQTINPSLLEKNSTSRSAGHNAAQIRRDGSGNMDILVRGRQMDMKIWAAEKLQRMLTLLIEESGSQTQGPRVQHAQRTHEDLSQVLRNEKIGATAEREQANMPREMVPFRGPFIYVHDMDEKTRPIMTREYPKVARRQDGEWPQFRSATIGKCPFVEDPAIRRELEVERAKHKAAQLMQQQRDTESIPRTRSTVALGAVASMEPPRRASPRKALQHVRNPSAPLMPQVSMGKPPCKPERQSSFPPMPEQPPCEFIKPSQMSFAREPTASGIQRSNMTSAIQSQMISSAAATGLKAGTSKEVNELKRKVLEKSHTGSLSIGSIPSSHRMNEITGALKNARSTAPQRAAKSRAQEKLGGIQEENPDSNADDIAAERAAQAAAKKNKPAKKDPKPGYCENCRDKYDDFEEHTISRKHRKFAMTQSNWDELDALLRKLQQA